MFKKGYYITAELRVKNTDKISEAKAALTKLCEETLKEPGCSLFTLHQCSENKDRFLLWERFEDEAAFKQHFIEQHTKDYVELDLTEIVQYFQSDIVCTTSTQ
ncbi:putative quinol monooxygenase [Alkalimarinus coralli]|uniref:putative quinol monooxygenase n=1 Tax=Alkalimarinus coralli TaxID=2935863 RepID=UPI00202B7263|nr:antibiotic biosynthesis monooxygenase [Alkalimarinus coralli]